MRGAREGEQMLRFEDFVPGRVFELGQRALSEEEIVSFAAIWDPQPMHVHPDSADAALFGGVIASGWQTACVWMRLYVDTVLSQAAMLAAPGVEDLRWLKPVRPEVMLTGRAKILERWVSDNRPGRGTIRLYGELIDDRGDQVMTMSARGHTRLRQEVREK